jgi:hypothetical protein
MGRLGSNLVLAQLLSELPNRMIVSNVLKKRKSDQAMGGDTHGVHVPDGGRREDAGLGRGLGERSRGPGDGVEVDYRGYIKLKLDVSQGTVETGRRARERDTDDLA